MTQPMIFAIDLVAIGVLVFGMYFPRYRRRDMVLAYIGLNVGVMAVATALASGAVGAGLGLGLFGVLSIIRLRSSELEQEEVAYYFASLTLGLLGGVEFTSEWLGPVLSGVLLVAIFVADHPRLYARYRHQVLTLDSAIPDEQQLIQRLETLLGAQVRRVAVKRLDLVNDTTTVDVRYQIRTAEPRAVEPMLSTSSSRSSIRP